MTLRKWLKKLVTFKPHLTIGGKENPYMLRWHLFPRNPFVNVYLHKFLRDDDDRAMHDHPWHFLSIMLKGAYVETRPFVPQMWDVLGWVCFGIPYPESDTDERRAPSIAFRRATDRHYVTLLKNSDGTPRPCWTIVITGPKLREWGFWCPKGFVIWTKFVAQDDEGNVGKGCGE